jgi:hypothetical protein
MQRDITPPTAPTALEMLDDLSGLGAGVVTMLIPLFTIAVPGLILLLVAPIALLLIAAAIPAVLVGALLAPPFLLVRALRRRRSAT